jgi:hypothetical protein
MNLQMLASRNRVKLEDLPTQAIATDQVDPKALGVPNESKGSITILLHAIAAFQGFCIDAKVCPVRWMNKHLLAQGNISNSLSNAFYKLLTQVDSQLPDTDPGGKKDEDYASRFQRDPPVAVKLVNYGPQYRKKDIRIDGKRFKIIRVMATGAYTTVFKYVLTRVPTREKFSILRFLRHHSTSKYLLTFHIIL